MSLDSRKRVCFSSTGSLYIVTSPEQWNLAKQLSGKRSRRGRGEGGGGGVGAVRDGGPPHNPNSLNVFSIYNDKD